MSFNKIDPNNFVISSDSVTSTLFTNQAPTLTTFFTSSTQRDNNRFYLDVYNTGSQISGSEVQFSLAYGHVSGSGSYPINALVPINTPSRITFGQFRNLIYGDENAGFNFGTGNPTSRDILVINVNRARYKEKLFPGSLNLTLISGSTSLVLTDNSKDISSITYVDAGRIYDIVSGSSGHATTFAPSGTPSVTAGYTISGSYGKFLPDVGLILLNPRALILPAASGGIVLNINETININVSQSNNTYLYDSIFSGSSFQLNSEETITADYVFVMAGPNDFNYTVNPSMISGSGDFVYSSFVNNPQTYITTVGLYNDANELLSVGKLSRPLVKDFTKGSLIRIKLTFGLILPVLMSLLFLI